MEKSTRTSTFTNDVYATFWMRMLAHNIDLLIIILPLFLLRNFLENETVLYGTAALIYLIYHISFEISSWKGTPGKKLVNVSVRKNSFQDPGVRAVVLRNLFKILSVIPLFAGFAMAKFTKKNQCLHDWLSDTVIICDQPIRKLG